MQRNSSLLYSLSGRRPRGSTEDGDEVVLAQESFSSTAGRSRRRHRPRPGALDLAPYEDSDWLAVKLIQRRSLRKAAPKQKGTLRCFDLWKPNDVSTMPWRRDVLGAILSVPHLISVHPVPTESLLSASPSKPLQELLVTDREYFVDGRPAVRITFPKGEYFVVEPHQEEEGDYFASIAWTSGQDLGDAIRQLGDMLRLFEGSGQIVTMEGTELKARGRYPEKPLPIRDVLRTFLDRRGERMISQTPSEVEFVRIDMPEHSLLWRRLPAEEGQEEHCEVAVMTSTLDLDYLKLLIARTGSEAIRATQSTDLLDRVQKFAPPLRRKPVTTRLGKRP